MIDVAKETKKFKPIDLNFIPGKYAPTSDRMYDSFVLYNKALHQLQLNRYDEAKNYLRKATTLFPDFYEANMVLGILIFAGGDRIGAVRIFNSINDASKREDAIKFLDHLVEEAEKPETKRNVGKNFAERHMGNFQADNDRTSGRATERDVLGNNSSGNLQTSSIYEARYSKGRVFEGGGSGYEPQDDTSWDSYVSRSSGRGQVNEQRKGTIYAGSQISESIPRPRNMPPRKQAYSPNARTYASEENGKNITNSKKNGVFKAERVANGYENKRVDKRTNKSTNDGEAFNKQLKDINDFKKLNKYLLIVIAILLLYAIIVSAVLANKNSEINKLKSQISNQNIITSVINSNELQI